MNEITLVEYVILQITKYKTLKGFKLFSPKLKHEWNVVSFYAQCHLGVCLPMIKFYPSSCTVNQYYVNDVFSFSVHQGKNALLHISVSQ